MKKIVIVAVSMLIASTGVKAQTVINANYRGVDTPRHEVSLGYGIFPLSDVVNIFSDLFSNVFDVDITDSHSSGAISLGYAYRINKTISVGGTFAYAGYWGQVENEGKLYKNFFSIMPQVKFQWLEGDLVGLYSRANVGLMIIGLRRTYEDGTPDANDSIFSPTGQLSLIGVEVGRRIAGYAELGWGSSGLLTVGIRGRF